MLKEVGDTGTDESQSLAELAGDLRKSREVLQSVEAQALAGVANVLVRTTGQLAHVAGKLHELSPDEWMTPEQAAAHVGATSKESFEKIAVSEGIPRHRLATRLVRYSRKEIDEWLMSR